MMRMTIGVVFAAAFTISGAAQDVIAQSGVPAVAFPKPAQSMSASLVRRDKAALSSGCESHPANAPAGKQPEQLWR